MQKVTSLDGTQIAFDQTGTGQPVILVAGALGHRKHEGHIQLTELLSPDFMVINYDRRGRGDSGDTKPYTVEREIEDIEALIDHVGGKALVWGGSSGAILALETANKLPQKIKKLALYEPPFIINDSRPPLPVDFVEQIQTAIHANRPDQAIDILMTHALLMHKDELTPLRDDPNWDDLLKTAPTIVYDAKIQCEFMLGKPLPPDRWPAVTMPTLVVTGGESMEFFGDAAEALIDQLPDAKHRILEGQTHHVSMKALAPVLKEFFK